MNLTRLELVGLVVDQVHITTSVWELFVAMLEGILQILWSSQKELPGHKKVMSHDKSS